MKRDGEEKIGLGQGAQNGKPSSGAPQALGLEINSRMKRDYEEKMSLGQGSQNWRSSSGAPGLFLQCSATLMRRSII